MADIHDAGKPEPSGKTQFPGEIKNPSLGTKLLFRMGLMSAADRRAFNADTLERHGLKLERAVCKLIATTNGSLGRASKHEMYKAVGAAIGKVTRQMEKIQGFNDTTRADGASKAAVLVYGTEGVPTDDVVHRAVGRSLDGCDDRTKNRVLDYMAGIAGVTDPEDIRDRTDSLVAYSNKLNPAIPRLVVESFKWAREDQALRQALTEGPLDAGKLAAFGEQIRAERTTAQPLSAKMAGTSKDHALLGDVPSLNGKIEGGTLPRPLPPGAQKACATERSFARVVDQLSAGQRKQLREEIPRYREEVATLRQQGEFEKAASLREAVDTILSVLNKQASSAEKAFGRHEKAQFADDLQRVSAIFSRKIPHIKKSMGHALFGNEKAVDREMKDAISKIVSGCRKACGSHKEELNAGLEKESGARPVEPRRVASRAEYYEKLADALSAKFQARLPHRAYRPDYIVKQEMLERLMKEDEAQAGVPLTPTLARLGEAIAAMGRVAQGVALQDPQARPADPVNVPEIVESDTPAALVQGSIFDDPVLADRVDGADTEAKAVVVADSRLYTMETYDEVADAADASTADAAAAAAADADADSGVESDDEFPPPPPEVQQQLQQQKEQLPPPLPEHGRANATGAGITA